jgi:hypothetical protein
MVLSAVLMSGVGHSTAPWYIAIPIVVVVIGARIWMFRRRGGRGGGGPFRRGPFGGSGDDT